MSERTPVTAGVCGQVCLKAFVWESRAHTTREHAWSGWNAHRMARQRGDKTDAQPEGASHSRSITKLPGLHRHDGSTAPSSRIARRSNAQGVRTDLHIHVSKGAVRAGRHGTG